MDNFQHIADQIQKADTIVIYRHVHPDMDAIGSQMGLKYALKNMFPEKTVLAAGDMSMEGIYMDSIDPDQLKNALAIILDTSNAARIDTDSFKEAKDSLRIDHHVFVEKIADEEWVDEKASATCQMLAVLFKKLGWNIGAKAAQYLYQGLTADNIRFSIASVNKESFEAAAYLLEQGADVVKAELENFGSTYKDFAYENVVKNKAKKEGRFLYSVINADEYLQQGLSFSKAKEKVYALSGIKDVSIWALFTQMEDGIHYSCSLRSRTIVIRDIAVEFGGGGHDFASGIKNLSVSDVAKIIELCVQRSL